MRRNEKGKELEMTLIDLSFTIEKGMPFILAMYKLKLGS